jgi:hypothetical protein
MGGASGTCGRDKKYIKNLGKKIEGRRPLVKSLSIDGWMDDNI